MDAAHAAGASRQHWRDVVGRLGQVAEPTTDDLALLAQAHWWLCDMAAAIRLEERLHDRLRDEGRPVEAAHAALRVCLMWALRGDLTLAEGWQGRAGRLLEDQPRGVVHGYADYLSASSDLDFADEVDQAAEAGDRLRGLATQLQDRTLECFALALSGMAAVRRGDLTGYAAIDEALIPVLGGQVDPRWGGDVFCTVIHLCESLGDLARMRAWTDALNSWAAPLSDTFLYAGVTRLHQLQLLRAEGAWDLVERELGERSADLAPVHGWLAATGFYELGEVHRLRGRDAEARTAYARARALGIEPQPGEALLLHGAGETARALDGLRVALAGAGVLERARLIPDTVEIALAAREVDLARHLTEELTALADQVPTPGPVAGAACARAACAMAAGRWDEAETHLLQAARIHREQRQRHASARVHEALATVHHHRGESGRAAAAEATARAIYDALGAEADLARLAAGNSRPGGLTAREVEVLVRVAAGLTNKEVARDLVISDKTVGRHLSSIFTKIGVSSRTAAASWAREHGLAWTGRMPHPARP